MTSPRIRPMVLADCERVAEIRVRGWRSAYAGLIPQAYLDGLSVAENTERRRAHLASAPADVVNLVAEDGAGRVVGWGCHGPYRNGDSDAPTADAATDTDTDTDTDATVDAELYALYVDPRYAGRGAGRALLTESVRQCSAAGHPRLLLWVLRGNAPARRFYARAGFRPDGAEEAFEVAGAAIPEVRYVRELTG